MNSNKILEQKIFKHIYKRVVINKKLIKAGTYLKYLKHCEQINKRTDFSLFEKHHIIPRAAGGTNDNTNIIMLSTRQHILAHLIRYLEKGENCDKTAYIFRKATKHHKARSAQKLMGKRWQCFIKYKEQAFITQNFNLNKENAGS